MSATAFALRDGRRVAISPIDCIRWVRFHFGEPRDPLAYETIPHRVLPPGVDVAYFNKRYFLDSLPPNFYDTVAGAPAVGGVAPPVRDEPFFALSHDGLFVTITNGQALNWSLDLHPTNPPTEARFESVPMGMLPEGVRVAWFDAYTFLMGMPGWAQPVVPGWSLRDLAPLDVAPDLPVPGWSLRDLAPLAVAPDLPPARRRRVAAKAVAKAKAAARPPLLAPPCPQRTRGQ